MGNCLSRVKGNQSQPDSGEKPKSDPELTPTSTTAQPNPIEELPKAKPDLAVPTPTPVITQATPVLEEVKSTATVTRVVAQPNLATRGPKAQTKLTSPAISQPDPVADEPESEVKHSITPLTTDLSASNHSRLRSIASTGLNAFKFALENLSTVSEFIPAPGLTPAIEGVLGCIEKVMQTSENAEIVHELEKRVTRIHSILAPLRGQKFAAETLIPVVVELNKELESLAHEINEVSSHNVIFRFFNSDDDASSLARHTANLDNIIVSFSLTLMVNRVLDERGEKIHNWLNPPNPYGNYRAARGKQQPNTGSWFLESERFSQWKKTTDKFICISGIPGCGKTVLCSSIIRNIELLCMENSSCALAYFFFDSRDAQGALQKHQQLICSLIWQLSSKCGTIPAALDQLCGEGKLPLSTDSLQSVLQAIVAMNQFKQVYIIIDSLDECTDPESVLDWMQTIFSWGKQKVHFLVTSREGRGFEEQLKSLHPEEVSMEVEAVNSDIQQYVDAVIEKNKTWSRPDYKEVKELIKTTLMEGSRGMFRLVAMQLKELEMCYTRAEVKKQLKVLPKELNNVYDLILSRIPPKDCENALHFLQWLAFSAKPLRSNEIVEVSGVDLNGVDGPYFDAENRYDEPESILNVCSDLVAISEGIIKLAHFSVKEYLVSNSPPEYFRMNEVIVHSCIAQTCLAYLLQFKTEVVTEDSIEHLPLGLYAGQYWTFHIHSAGGDNSVVLQRLILELMESNSTQFLSWVRLHNLDTHYQISEFFREFVPAAPLYYAVLAGLAQTSKILLERGADLHVQGGLHGTVLAAASYGGSKDIVQLLLDKGADVNVKGGENGSALGSASHGGSKDIVQLLLDNGADVNLTGGEYGSALGTAVHRGSKDIVQLLLHYGADVNGQGGIYGSVLGGASFRGSKDIVQLLLDNGADVNMQEGQFGSALAAAAFGDSNDIVQLLLENGADVNTQGAFIGSPLGAASYAGSKDTVQLLLEKGADVNIEGGEYGSALGAASSRGSKEIVQLLLDHGADVNLTGENGSALGEASMNGSKDIVQLLLDKGANINAQIGGHGTALGRASIAGMKDIVQFLLEKGSDVNIQGGEYGSALGAAAFVGSRDIVQLLLENGADVNIQGGEYGSALGAASYVGSKDIVQLLLSNGADVNIQGGVYGSALGAASYGGSEDIAQLLLEHGADVNSQGGVFSSALGAASYGGSKDIVQLLLDHGADVNITGGEHGSALRAASVAGNDDIVQLLVDNSAIAQGPDAHFLVTSSSQGTTDL